MAVTGGVRSHAVEFNKAKLLLKHSDETWSAAKHADQPVRTGVLRRTSYTTYTLMNVPDLQGSSVARTIRKAKTIKLPVV